MMTQTTNLCVCGATIAKQPMTARGGGGGRKSFDVGSMTGAVVILARPRN